MSLVPLSLAFRMIISDFFHFAETPTCLLCSADDHAFFLTEEMEVIRRKLAQMPIKTSTYLKALVPPSAFLPVTSDELTIFLSKASFSTCSLFAISTCLLKEHSSNSFLFFLHYHFFTFYWIIPITLHKSILTLLPSTNNTQFFCFPLQHTSLKGLSVLTVSKFSPSLFS